MRGGATILISGGTSSGKTTFLNALLREIPEHERVILVEDTPEIRLGNRNGVGLIAVKGETGEARVTTDDLLQAALRLRPDRIVLGELRGGEAVSFLRAINTGHPGSFSTIHANSPCGALEQLALMVMQSGLGLSRLDTIAYVRSVVDLDRPARPARRQARDRGDRAHVRHLQAGIFGLRPRGAGTTGSPCICPDQVHSMLHRPVVIEVAPRASGSLH